MRALLRQHRGWIASCLQRVPQVGEPQQPERMAEIVCAARTKRNPTGIGNPTMFLGPTFVEKSVADGAGKWNVDDPAGMHVSNFRVAHDEFPTAKTMGMNGHVRP